MSTPPVLVFHPESTGGIHVDLSRLVQGRALITGNSGAGKSTLLRYMLEQTHGQIQQIVLDPEGEFASLRGAFPYLLAGGRDADVPADPKTAKVLCRRLLELGASAVIDLNDLKLPERRRFVSVFLDELMHLPRSLWRPVLLALDEAHAYAPERGSGEAESTAAVITVATQGRKRGYTLVAATQRLSKLHKDVAAELLNVFIGRTGLDVDLKRAGDTLGFDKESRSELRTMEQHTWHAFGPAVSDTPVHTRTGATKTSAAPPGEVAPPPPPPPAAVKKVLTQLAELQHEAEEEARSIEDLQKQLATAKAQVRKLERGAPAAVIDDKAVARAVAAAERELRKELDRSIREHKDVERQLRDQIRAQSSRLERAGKLAAQIADLGGVQLPEIKAAPTVIVAPSAPGPVSRPEKRSAPRQERAASPVDPDAKVTRPQLRILEVLAALQGIGLDAPDRSTVAVFADQSPKSSGYANNLGSLRTAGFIDYPAGGCVAITDDGLLQVGEVPEIGSLHELQEAWLSRVSNPQRRMLEQLIEIYPDSIDRNALADLTSQSSSSSGFANNLGFLRNSLGLIDYPSGGMVVATKRLFPDGLS